MMIHLPSECSGQTQSMQICHTSSGNSQALGSLGEGCLAGLSQQIGHEGSCLAISSTVIETLSKLSRTPIALAAGKRPFPTEESVDDEDIYKGLPDLIE
ncbi:Guanine nucleotide exchange factor VAV3 [Varanus komodoensis]|nr:Guanine nucleotide exchange factor VAV3 [Varanus komodoensis]